MLRSSHTALDFRCYRPSFPSTKHTSFTIFMDRSSTNSFKQTLSTTSSSSSSLLKQPPQNRNPVLACRALPDTSPREDDSAVHGSSETIVGVLGGGQLGRMLCQAASQMAIKVVVLDPQQNCPASALSYQHMIGSFDDSAAVEEFAKRCGVLTFEIEHVNVATLEKLELQGVDCQPKASTIRIIQVGFILFSVSIII
uniref:PurT/PurK-like preATP-grasp domain-containing protein n=1 Tax=Cannabis sativa TaxID=3483 RepID=A0A803R4G9_CANSA